MNRRQRYSSPAPRQVLPRRSHRHRVVCHGRTYYSSGVPQVLPALELAGPIARPTLSPLHRPLPPERPWSAQALPVTSHKPPAPPCNQCFLRSVGRLPELRFEPVCRSARCGPRAACSHRAQQRHTWATRTQPGSCNVPDPEHRLGNPSWHWFQPARDPGSPTRPIADVRNRNDTEGSGLWKARRRHPASLPAPGRALFIARSAVGPALALAVGRRVLRSKQQRKTSERPDAVHDATMNRP